MPELSRPDSGLSNRPLTEQELAHWLRSPLGRYVVDWESTQIDSEVADIFGFNAVQIGLPQQDFLRANRIAMRARIGLGDTAQPAAPVAAQCQPEALPFAGQSIDLVVLPHVLEFSADPHQVLREVERVLIAEGQIVICGFNPLSLWGLRKQARRRESFPWRGRYLALPRLKDWLSLLGFEIESCQFGCYAPPFEQQKWLQRWQFTEQAGRRWWKFSGAVYMLRAVKRVPGMRLITPCWQKKTLRNKALQPVVRKTPKEIHGQ